MVSNLGDENHLEDRDHILWEIGTDPVKVLLKRQINSSLCQIECGVHTTVIVSGLIRLQSHVSQQTSGHTLGFTVVKDV